MQRHWRWLRLSLVALLVAGGVAVAAPLLARSPDWTEAQQFSQSHLALPTPQVHPLPPSLARWPASPRAQDYFDQIQPVDVDYLVWSEFPVSVYVEPLHESEQGFAAQRSQQWIAAVQTAIAEWNAYLPLQVVSQAETADITILRSTPPLRLGERGQVPRARSAQTRFDLYIKSVNQQRLLAHRVTIQIRPDQAANYLQAATRHELGHAIGIWGHSQQQTDVMYFSQVRTPPLISARDINTLKRIYEQPTRLGWALPTGAS